MQLLERYLVQIGRFLPKQDKEDTLKELRSLILENYDNQMNTEDTVDERIYNVIKEFGKPRDVASRYKTEQPLLSREIEPLVFLILKITSFTLPGAMMLAGIIGYFQSHDEVTTMGLLLDMAYSIPSILTTLLTALAFIYLLFVLIGRRLPLEFKLKEMTFEPYLLPAIPKSALKISKFEAIFNIFGGVFFLYLFNLEPGLISVTYEGVREPLLNSNFEKILPLLNISVFLTIGYNIAFLYKGAKTKISGTVEFFQGILAGVVLILLASTNVFNEIIISGYDLSVIPKIFKIMMIVGAVASIIGSIVKYIKVLLSEKD